MFPAKAAKALRKFCLECQGGSSPSILACSDTSCYLYPFRLCTIHAPTPEERPLRAVRLHCLACAGSREDVRKCDAKETCPLWSFRFGVLPATFKRVAARRRTAKETLLLPGFRAIQF